MKKLLLILFIYLGLISQAYAISNPLDYYSAICTSEQSIGLRRIDGIYSEVNWEEDNYIISKKESTSTNCPEGVDNSIIKIEMDVDDNPIRGRIDACYNIRIHGESFQDRQTRKCIEIWHPSLNKKESFDLSRVICYASLTQSDYFIFKPNGQFERSSLMGSNDLMSNPGALVLTVGRCSTI